MTDRLVPTISLKDFESRRKEITKQLVDAAENSGFFMLIDHGISLEEIQTQFATSKSFFSLPKEVKGKTPHDINHNVGWEYKAQTRRLTGTDQKESLWLKSTSTWPSDADVPNFRANILHFINKCAAISAKVLECFAIELGFPVNYFKEPIDPMKSDTLTSLRMLHYPPSENVAGMWGAGAHTDVGCLTLLFQQDGGEGLEICPVSWSDDRFKATYHRVQVKEVGKNDSRYSIAYFNQGRKDFVFQGPKKKYPAMTCGEYIDSYTQLQFGIYHSKDRPIQEMKGASLVAAKN